MMNPPISIVLADDHELIRDGLRSLLDDIEGLEVVGEAADGVEALEQVRISQPNLLIVDIRMPRKTGIETVRGLHSVAPNTRALVLSMHDSEDYVLESVEAGAFGYILKGAGKEEFLKAIRQIHHGEKYFSADISKIIVNKYLETVQQPIINKPATPELVENQEEEQDLYLTKRELQILKLVISGLSNKEISDQLAKSVRTIEAHRFNLMKKLGAKNHMELSQKAREIRLI
jgi:DNA-binding NarL/FixJ family response regulator